MDLAALRLLVLVLLFGSCGLVSAALVPSSYVWRGGGVDGPSGSEWCTKLYAGIGGTLQGNRAYPTATNPPQWECYGVTTGNVNWGYVAVQTCIGGAWNSTLQGCYTTVVSCPAGQAASSTGVCRAICPAFGSQTGSHGVMLSSSGSSFALCIGDCVYAPDVSAHQADGTWTNWGPYTSMGTNCTGAEGGTGTPVPAVCPAAQCQGWVNGVSVCLPCGEVKEPPKTTGTTAPPVDAGSAPSGAAPGSSSTTEQTSCVGGQCTTSRTTVTVGASGGQTSQTTTTTQPIGTYCSANPGAAVCAAEKEEPSSWGGSCAGFQCGGDAVQCAIAREQHVRNCALFDQATDLSRVGTAAATGDNPSDHPRNQVQSTTFALSSMLDASPLFGGSGGCPADYAFSYGGQSLVIPFSQTCDVLHMLGAMWMGICYLVAATIVFYRR